MNRLKSEQINLSKMTSLLITWTDDPTSENILLRGSLALKKKNKKISSLGRDEGWKFCYSRHAVALALARRLIYFKTKVD